MAPIPKPSPTTTGLLKQAKKDVSDFLTQRKDIFFSESDLQMDLAIWLNGTKHYQNVYTEYFVPVSTLPGFPWKSNNKMIYVDIVAEREGQYVPIELKYKTKAIQPTGFTRFGQPVSVGPLTNQVAYNDSLYHCWKDVKRLELIKQQYKNVVGGLAVAVSNAPVYWNGPSRANVLYAPFSMQQGRKINGPSKLNWLSGDPKPGFPPFTVNGNYQCNWQQTGITADEFRFCLLDV